MQILVKHTVFVGGSRRRPGDVMEVADDTKGDWFDVIDKPSKPVKPKADTKGGAPDTKQADGLV